MHLANQRLAKPDKLSQGAHSQTSYPKVQWENTLDKKRREGGEKQQETENEKQRARAEENVRL